MKLIDLRFARLARKALLTLALPAALVVPLGSCAVYNEECARFMEDPDGVAGYLGGDVSIARDQVRLHDNAIGQLVADAYYNAFNAQSADRLPKAAIVNGGAIREDGVCEARTILSKGALKRKVLRDILPFDNRVILTTITHKNLKRVLEHGMANYSTRIPPGSYLQVSGIRVQVDCSKPAEELDSSNNLIKSGERVQSIRLRVRGCSLPNEEDCYGEPIDMMSDEEIYMALDSYLFSGGDKFTGFGAEKGAAGSFNFEVVAQYFSETYPEERPLAQDAQERVTLVGCGVAEGTN